MMTEVTVGAPRTLAGPGWPGIAASITIDGRTFDIFFRASQGPLTFRADPFLALALLPAMRTGLPLRLEGAVSARLLRNTSVFQDVICTWYPSIYQKITIHAETVVPAEQPSQTGAFFSGGVDSFYTAITRQDELSHLILIHGLDISLDDQPMRQKVSFALRQACAELGKPLLEVETNMRTILDAYTGWSRDSHGAALASVALALAPQFRKVYISATHTYDHICAHGSHPLIDPLWSTEETEIIQGGVETGRWQKLRSMLDNQTVRRYLRSCWEHPQGAYNCCHCSICLMNMSFLRLCGVSDHFPTYPQPLDLAELARFPVHSPAPNMGWSRLLLEVEMVGGDSALAQALRTVLSADPGATAWFGQTPAEQAHLHQFSAQVHQVEDHVKRLHQMDARIAELEQQLTRMETSHSWRLTAPLRALGGLAHHSGREGAT